MIVVYALTTTWTALRAMLDALTQSEQPKPIIYYRDMLVHSPLRQVRRLSKEYPSPSGFVLSITVITFHMRYRRHLIHS